MQDIAVRYGASVPLSITIDDDTATEATLYVGFEGGSPIIAKTGLFIDGLADLSLAPSDTAIPLNKYSYQINVLYANGNVDKFPSPEACDGGLPNFTVLEALDVIEVS